MKGRGDFVGRVTGEGHRGGREGNGRISRILILCL